MTHQGIVRSEHPDWFGWFIVDMLAAAIDPNPLHVKEIEAQLDYEVRYFKYKHARP